PVVVPAALSDWGAIGDHPPKIRFEIAIASPLALAPGLAAPTRTLEPLNEEADCHSLPLLEAPDRY
ncbi:hypothetical protein BN1708_009999, partial [Verticillium longisporum]